MNYKEKIKEEMKKISAKCEEMKKIYEEADMKKEKACKEHLELMEPYESALKRADWAEVAKLEEACMAAEHEILGAKKMCMKAKAIKLEIKNMKLVCFELMMDWEEKMMELRHKGVKGEKGSW